MDLPGAPGDTVDPQRIQRKRQEEQVRSGMAGKNPCIINEFMEGLRWSRNEETFYPEARMARSRKWGPFLGFKPKPKYPYGTQQGSDYYDAAFDTHKHWHRHYTTSRYYMLWTVIIDRLRRTDDVRLLEIGCGPGQFASAIQAAGFLNQYVGFDLSPKAIALARKAAPQLRFEIEDALTTDLLEQVDYNAAVSTEFLEHIHGDLAVIARIRDRARFIATVPNFPYVSHVRHFGCAQEVYARYADYFDDFSVAAIPANAAGKTFFLMDGVRKQARYPASSSC